MSRTKDLNEMGNTVLMTQVCEQQCAAYHVAAMRGGYAVGQGVRTADTGVRMARRGRGGGNEVGEGISVPVCLGGADTGGGCLLLSCLPVCDCACVSCVCALASTQRHRPLRLFVA